MKVIDTIREISNVYQVGTGLAYVYYNYKKLRPSSE